MDFFYVDVLIDGLQLEDNQIAFTYCIPQNLAEHIKIGTPVIVPLKNLTVGGYIVKFRDKPQDIECRQVLSVMDDSVFDKDYLDLLKWVSDYYLCSVKNVIQAAIPQGLLTRVRKTVKVTGNPESFADLQTSKDPVFYKLCSHLKDNMDKEVSFLGLKRSFGNKLNIYINKLREAGVVEIKNTIIVPESKGKQMLYAMLMANEITDQELPAKQNEVINILKNSGGAMLLKDLIKQADSSKSPIDTLAQKGYIKIYKDRVLRDPDGAMQSNDIEIKELTDEQILALETIENMLSLLTSGRMETNERTMLIHGVTGSGKTEIYIRACEKAIRHGGTALVMVPEISMTPQILGRFKDRFQDDIGILHSGLSKGERIDEWQKIKSGLYKIVIGVRSAVFAPLKDLKLIIIDEEHENSYKQDNNPRYDARTVALKRAEMSNSVVVMGTATPSLESFYKASQGEIKLISLTKRVMDRPMPPVQIIDMGEEFKHGNKSIFSKTLKNAIDQRLANKEQTILFINRRGYSTFVFCRACGNPLTCPSCSVSLVYHVTSEDLRCHYCDYTTQIPKRCPHCQSPSIKYFGTGTQKIEELTKKAFPSARIQRFDSDVTTRKHSHKEILERFKNNEIDIIIGTQIIAKGLDFPNVTLVGSLIADSFLNMPDFRANERTFQLLTQVAGRAGRGEALSEVIIQTYVPEHTSILKAQEHDYIAFYNDEIQNRQALNYPPFMKLINITTASTDCNEAIKYSHILKDYLKEADLNSIYAVMGPVPSILSKIRNYYRWQILIKCSELEEVKNSMKQIVKKINYPSGIKLKIDIDPINMF